MSFSTRDTIVAIATPPGRGGIGVVRLSGVQAHTVARRLITHQRALEPRYATLTKVRLTAQRSYEAKPPVDDAQGKALERPDTTYNAFDPRRNAIDQVVVTYFPGPASYTGDDVVELSAHGSPVILRGIVQAAIDGGARLAEPGEFTLRAFLNGRIDLMQAEAVADLVDSVTPLQARTAFDQLEGTLTRAIAEIDAALFDFIARLEASVDFPEDGYHFVDPAVLAHAIDDLLSRTSALLAGARRGRLIREGLQVTIMGRPNVGKSTLFNALAGASRAIVTDAPGTTRDLVTEIVDIEGLRVTLVDTAGLRNTTDPAEAQGVERSRGAITVSDLVLRVVDGSVTENADDKTSQIIDYKQLTVINKSDLPRMLSIPGAVPVSAATGAGLDELRRRIATALDGDDRREHADITNVRHIVLVTRAHEALGRARAAALSEAGSMSEEFVLADLQDARAALEEITGKRATDDMLAHIFSTFCIGK